MIESVSGMVEELLSLHIVKLSLYFLAMLHV